jgi:mevalonate kinase
VKRYPAKLLLFGEHVLLRGAPALAVPVPAFSGGWSQAESPAPQSEQLAGFARSLRDFSAEKIDAEAFERDLYEGLFFDSDIPIGYGLGSSGALCAAVYDRYCRQKTNDLADLKVILGRMEGFFHGASSGIDPLTSYLAQPLLIRQKTEVALADLRPWRAHAPIVFLLDSQTPRRTGPLVEWFLAQSERADFREKMEGLLLPAHEAMLAAWLAADAEAFWPSLRRVSQFQWTHFEPMIPPRVWDFWRKSLDNEAFMLKICGAGGGGFVLGFARERAAAEALRERWPIVFPFDLNFDAP